MTSAAYDVRLLQQGALRGSEIQQAARAGAVKAENRDGRGFGRGGLKNEKRLQNFGHGRPVVRLGLRRLVFRELWREQWRRQCRWLALFFGRTRRGSRFWQMGGSAGSAMCGAVFGLTGRRACSRDFRGNGRRLKGESIL